MPDQLIITGTITLPDGAARAGIRVQAFDRDMPSRERRAGSAPQQLGAEAVTDAEGRFQITYALEQFSSGEGISQFRRLKEKNADLSFRVFDGAGQSLSIRSIEALNREFRSEQIIFNAPASLEVRIFIEAPPAAGTSEYDQLLAIIAPVLEDVPLTELADEDLLFLSNELGLEQQREVQQRLEWLRRCALLAQETRLPAEAFYGWGRLNVPADLEELAAVPLKELSKVLERLISTPEDTLQAALTSAVADNIIPDSFRSRVEDIVRQLVRRGQVLHSVVARLQDAETKASLAGYTVITFDRSADEENRGLDITDSEGKFSFDFFVARQVPAGAPAREFRLEVRSPLWEKLPEDARFSVDPNQPTTTLVLAFIKVPKPEVSTQRAQFQTVLLEAPAELRAFLSTKPDIQTLADIRRQGGLRLLADLPASDPVVISNLESLVDLDRVSPDITVSKGLKQKSFDSVLAIADTPHSEFVARVSEGAGGLSELDAARLHVMASTQTHLLNNMLVGMAANTANGYKILKAEGANPAAAELFQPSCGCSDCQAAVSPAAYLTALLDYALKHVRQNKTTKISLPFLVGAFHQPFADLPTDCEAVEQPVRQVRICVETLRGYLGSRPLADATKEAALGKGEAAYAFAIYLLLLSQIGTTYEEIRRIRSETPENRKALAERLGIDLTVPRPADLPNDETQNGDELDQLFLDASAALPADHLLTAPVMEMLFGLPDTARDPLSEGTKLGDDQAQLTRWNLNGAAWNQNTDSEGKVYVTLANPAANVFRVELYQDPARTKLVASGEVATAAGTVKLNPENNSYLSGAVSITFSAGSTAISIAAIPTVLSWKLKHLRTLWSSQDHPVDAYSNLAAGADAPAPPLIDPDLIGVDDFRVPAPKLAPADPDRAFDIWLKRRVVIDKTLDDLKAVRETKGLGELAKQVLGKTLPVLDALFLGLTKGGTADEVEAAKASLAAFPLPVESFTRLMAIRVKDQLAESDSRNEKVTSAEWSEVYSILAQATKARLFETWRLAEQGAGIRLGPEEFWVSVREPQEGDWPPVPVVKQPLIDPDLVKLTELPEWLSGKQALALWNARRTAIDLIPGLLQQKHDATKDFEQMLRLALGHPAPGNALQHDLNALGTSLNSLDDTVRNQAVQQIETDLHLTVDNFNRLVVVKAANDQPVPAKKPTAGELAEVYALLAPARKIKHEYPQWVLEEKSAGLVYWQALKARLPRWRASLERRQAWQQALHARSQPPLLDALAIGPDDLQHVLAGDPAFDLWKARSARITLVHDGLKTTGEAAADALTGLNEIIKRVLGVELTDLEALSAEQQAGHSSERRLEQLNLAPGAFAYLMRIRSLAQALQPITDSEWETVYATLTQAQVQRESAAAQAEEQQARLLLAPEYFKIPKVISTPLPFSGPFAPLWLSTRQVRSDWQDTLQARIDQEDAVTKGLRSAIGAVEEVTLPALRDALIQASDAAGANLNEQAEWITARLLLDARSGGCRMTTRVAQALETLQTLLFDLRTGQFKQLAPVSLLLAADYFDEEWKWIGSYATFRAPTFVFLYPENILQPSLLKYRTPAFDTLITNTRGRLNPGAACKEGEAYAVYFRDVCSLQIEATCQASTIVYTGEGCDRRAVTVPSMFYLFGRAASGKVYWSAYDAGGSTSGYDQTFWKEFTGFADTADTKVVRIVGAMPYRKAVTVGGGAALVDDDVVLSAHIHLFCITEHAEKQALKLARLNLDNFGEWNGDGKAIELSTPLVPISSMEVVPVQTQNEFTPPGLIFHKKNYYKLYYRQLSSEGIEWEQNSVDWAPFFFQFQNTGAISLAVVPIQIKAALKVNSDDLLWLVTQNTKTGSLSLTLGELKPGVPSISRAWGFENTDFLGVLPGREEGHNTKFLINNQVSVVYLFWRDSSGSHYKRFASDDNKNNPVNDTLADLTGIPPNSGSGSTGKQILAYQRVKNAGAFYLYQYAESGSSLIGSATTRAVPRVVNPLNIPSHLSATDLQQRRQQIIDAFALNQDAPVSVLAYLKEAFYFVPMHLALALQRAGNYIAALDRFRTVYDYEAPIGPPNQRNIYYGLELDAKLPDVPVYEQADGWLLDPLNPHAIASTRHYAYTRFTIMAVARCLFDFADSEFTLDTSERLATARTLTLTGLGLLNLPELQQKLGICEDLIAELQIQPGKDVPPEVPAAVGEILGALTSTPSGHRHGGAHAATLSPGQLATVLNEANITLSGAAAWDVKLTEARAVVQAVVASAPLPPTTGAVVSTMASSLQEQHAVLITPASVDNGLQRTSRAVALKVFNGALPINPVGKPPVGKNPPALPVPPLPPVLTPALQFCIPPNPILKALRLRAELTLYKLRTCRNIAGLKRELDPYSAPTDTTSGMPTIGGGGQLTLPGIATLQPSLYRYPVLIERAKQLVQLAAQMEASMLSALEKRDAEAQTLLQARQQLGLAQAGVRLQDLRIGEANDGVTLTDLQQKRVQIQIETYDAWIQMGANQFENQMIDAYSSAAAAQRRATDDSSLIQEKQAVIAAAQLTAQIAAANPYLAAAAGLTSIAIDTALFLDQNTNLRRVINETAAAQIASVNAALERKTDEWQLQKRLAEQDAQIGEQQKKLADDHVQITAQERVIAGIGADSAKDFVEFLTNKFTNVELFDWMSNILEGVYSYFLQQATTTANLALNQLAFQNQEVPPAFIQSDYWQLAADGSPLGTADNKSADRRGLTGSARLLQDIFQLDQYAFNTNKRKLTLTRTLSLASLVPFEFQRFRETGVLSFATPMELFDRGFPGHYLRLIKRVRVSIVALVPPLQGIHATLSTTGPSRVVIGGDLFQTVTIRRAPEFIVLSAPNTATGVVELDAQADMLFPFEGSGLDMHWEFNMPKAANQIDYGTFADVLVTYEWSALHDSGYRQQVIQSLKPTVSADRPFSLRNQFADQWYDLHNAAQSPTPMTVRFTSVRADFPPNVEELKIQHVLLYFARSKAGLVELPVSSLRFTASDEAGTVGGSATAIDGFISTRRGNAGTWTAMIGKSPIGDWELTFPDTEEMRRGFETEEIEDILLVVTYAGRMPEWTNLF